MKLYDELMEHELPVYTFSKIGDNEEIEISLGQDAELNMGVDNNRGCSSFGRAHPLHG